MKTLKMNYLKKSVEFGLIFIVENNTQGIA